MRKTPGRARSDSTSMLTKSTKAFLLERHAGSDPASFSKHP